MTNLTTSTNTSNTSSTSQLGKKQWVTPKAEEIIVNNGTFQTTIEVAGLYKITS